MKILAELRTEVELGLIVYNSIHLEMYVYYEEPEIHEGIFIQNYIFNFVPDGVTRSISGYELQLGTDAKVPLPRGLGYVTFDELIADWPIAAQPVWTTMQTPERQSAEHEQCLQRKAAQEEAYQEYLLYHPVLDNDPF